MKEKLKVPKLRFREFDDEWEIKSLEKVLKERKIRKNISEETPLLAFAAGQGVIDRSERKTNNRDFLTKDSTQKKYLLTKYDDIVYNPSNLKYGAIDRNKHGQGVISPIYVTFETTEIPCFIELIVKSEKFKQRALQYEEGTVTKRQSVKPENLLCLNIVTPSLPEQQKIAGFLSKVDEKIEKLTKKKELLEQYKKGVMQKIFSQELRFKDDNGNDFPEWEEKELNSLGNSYSGLSGKSGDDFGSGLPYITYKSIFDNIRIDLKKVGYVNVGENESQTEVRTGDIFFTTSSETPEEVGMSSVLLDEVYERCFLNSFCFGFRFNSFEETMPMFMGYYFRSKKMRDKITSLAQGSTRYNLPKTKFLKILINIPSLQEQQKIADFLSVLDKKIDIVNKELGQVQEFKKGLLQQMFV